MGRFFQREIIDGLIRRYSAGMARTILHVFYYDHLHWKMSINKSFVFNLDLGGSYTCVPLRFSHLGELHFH